MKKRSLRSTTAQPSPVAWAGESYIYEVVGRGLPKVFYEEFENRERGCEEGVAVCFRFADIVMFAAAAAASGVIGNFAYDAIKKAVRAIRSPMQEIGGQGFRFEQVVSRKTYNRVRRTRHPKRRSRGYPTLELRQELETEYRMMVQLGDAKKK